MISAGPRSTVGLLLSGGLDSAILLGHLLEAGHRVQPFYVRSELVWQRSEQLACRRFLAAIAGTLDNKSQLADLVSLDLPVVDLYGQHWSVTGEQPPCLDSPDDAVYLPGRNALLVIKPAIWCVLHGIDRLALATLASNPFDDATDCFFAPLQQAIGHGTGAALKIVRPFDRLSKQEVMQLGSHLPLELTFSCLAPAGQRHCGMCNKCAERQAAFRWLSQGDPTPYANGTKRLEQPKAVEAGAMTKAS